MDNIQKTIIKHEHAHIHRHKHGRRLFTVSNIIRYVLVLVFLAFTAFTIANPYLNFYGSIYTLFLYLATACGFFLILFLLFFGFVTKTYQLFSGRFKKH